MSYSTKLICPEETMLIAFDIFENFCTKVLKKKKSLIENVSDR